MTDYYVDSKTGSDSNSGSGESPFATINRALKSTDANTDKIFVMCTAKDGVGEYVDFFENLILPRRMDDGRA